MGRTSHAPGRLELVRQFVNTLDEETGEDQIATPESLRAWLDGAGLPAVVAPADVRRAAELRGSLKALTIANNGDPLAPGTGDRLAGQAHRSRLAVTFDPAGRAVSRTGALGVDGSLGTILAIVADTMWDTTFRRLKSCRAGDCRWCYYDASRNATRTWCSMEICGNRAKVRAFRARHGAAPAG